MVIVLAVALTAVGLWSLGWVGSRHRVSHAADLLALAGASQFAATGSDQQACAQAKQGADQQRFELQSCAVAGVPASFVVTVRVCGELRPRIDRPGVPRRVCVSAKAGTANARP